MDNFGFHLILAFQYSIDGYYIYDSISKHSGGLFKYPDKETFFQKLREQAMSDMETQKTKHISLSIMKRD